MTSRAERRLYKRYLVEDGILAVLGNQNPKLGKILDISKGGLSFRYKGKGPETVEKQNNADLVILFDDTRTNFNKGPFKFHSEIVSDDKMIASSPAGMANVRRCSIQFKNLTFYRKSWLDYFIRHHSLITL